MPQLQHNSNPVGNHAYYSIEEGGTTLEAVSLPDHSENDGQGTRLTRSCHLIKKKKKMNLYAAHFKAKAETAIRERSRKQIAGDARACVSICIYVGH